MVSAANIVAAVLSLSLWTVFAAASKDELVPGTLLPGLWVYSCRFLNSTALQLMNVFFSRTLFLAWSEWNKAAGLLTDPTEQECLAYLRKYAPPADR